MGYVMDIHPVPRSSGVSDESTRCGEKRERVSGRFLDAQYIGTKSIIIIKIIRR